jgi:alpha-D-xyloside xylohydrolase
MFQSNRNNPNETQFSGGPNEIWSYGDTAYGVMKDLILMRQRIMPYIMEQMHKAADTGCPVMRPLLFDFPEDEATYPVGDEFLFGPQILVAPITAYRARSRRVYLPRGASWTEVHTGKTYEGGQTVTARLPSNTAPFFARRRAAPHR